MQTGYETFLTEKEKRELGLWYDPFRMQDGDAAAAAQALEAFNRLPMGQAVQGQRLLRGILGDFPEDSCITPPFFCGRGTRIRIGHRSFANRELLIVDEGEVRIGNDVKIGPRVSIYTVNHPMEAKSRRSGRVRAEGVTIEDDVWIGGSAVLLAGVTIGRGSVIGAGSVVTGDIPPGVFAAGNPCRVIRAIREEAAAPEQKNGDQNLKEA